jgi:ABC-type dipeptide/oligopeptide/nickel transport system permease subunit
MAKAVATAGERNWFEENKLVRQRSVWQMAAQRFLRSKTATVGAAYLVLILLITLAPGVFARYPPNEAFFVDAWQAPSAKYWFGTDALGRDVYSRVIYGIQTSMLVGLTAQSAILVIGVGLGSLAGIRGGWFDFLIMRLVDVMASFPQLLFTILLMATLGIGMKNIIIAIAVPGWVALCQVTRAQILSLRERQFVEAAEMTGARTWHIIRRHLVPNALAPIIVNISFSLPSIIMLEAGLSFLGAGIAKPRASLGQMVAEGGQNITYYWHLALFPSIALALLILAFAYVADGLRDALDPSATR